MLQSASCDVVRDSGDPQNRCGYKTHRHRSLEMRKTILALALTLGSTVYSNSAFAFGFGHFGPGLGLAHFGPGLGLAHVGPGLGLARFGGGALGGGHFSPRFGSGLYGRFAGGQLGPHLGSSYFGRGRYGGYIYGGEPHYGGYGYRMPYYGGFGYAGGPYYGASGYDSEPNYGSYASGDGYDDVYDGGERSYRSYGYEPSYYTTSGRHTRQLRRGGVHRRAAYRGNR